MSSLEVITANMALDNGDARRRYEGFNDLVLGRNSKPDILALQEVAWHPGEATLGALRYELGQQYDMELCPIYPGSEEEKGLVIISKYPISEHKKVDLSVGGKAIQLATIELPFDRNLQIANVHMEASPLKEMKRKRKIKEIIDLLSQNPDLAHLIVGDFNAERYFPSVRTVKRLGMDSIFNTLKTGGEHTYPTSISPREIVGHGYSKRHQYEFMKALGQFMPGGKFSKSGLRESVVDYIFHNKHIQPESAQVLSDMYEGQHLSDHKFIAAIMTLVESSGYDMADLDELSELDTTVRPELA